MAGITKMVDEQIKALRKERAELEALKEELDRRSFANANPDDKSELYSLQETLAALRREKETATDELSRLKEDRNQSIATFKAEIDQIHMEKTLESESAINQLQLDIDYLKATKDDMERQKERMFQELTDLQSQKESKLKQIQSEEQDFLAQKKNDRDNELQKISMEQSLQIAALEQTKTELQSEINSLEHKKSLEWEKVTAEISRYKSLQKAELETKREKIIAAAEAEGLAMLEEFRETKAQQLAELAEQEKASNRTLNNLEIRKKAISDDIDLLQYEYEKKKAENLVKIEKNRSEEAKLLEIARKEALERTELEKVAILETAEKLRIDTRLKMQEEQLAHEKRISELEQESQRVTSQIQTFKIQANRLQLESEQKIERLRSENILSLEKQTIEAMDELAKLKITRLREMEKSLTEYKEERERNIIQDIASLEDIKRQQMIIIEDKLKLFERLEKDVTYLTERVANLEVNFELVLAPLKTPETPELPEPTAPLAPTTAPPETSAPSAPPEPPTN
ncbi:MAG: hypothetical protein FWG68_06185 [Defluviitaleaceae bacterium]|nr:hypothetical protein [Defluviitaleaceae bacterium]